jgi:hypothetical protein
MSTNTVEKSFLRINGEEHNLKNLLDLLRDNKIIIDTVIAVNTNEDALSKITDTHIPIMSTQLTINASYHQVHKILAGSEEFSQYADNIL